MRRFTKQFEGLRFNWDVIALWAMANVCVFAIGYQIIKFYLGF